MKFDKINDFNYINVKYIRIHVYQYTERLFSSNLPYRYRKPKDISKFLKKRGSDGKQWPLTPFSFLTPWPYRPPAIENATMPSPCWAPHFMTQERLMFSNPTPSELCLSPAVTMSDNMLSAYTPPLHCASILQPATPLLVVTFQHLCSNVFQPFQSC